VLARLCGKCREDRSCLGSEAKWLFRKKNVPALPLLLLNKMKMKMKMKPKKYQKKAMVPAPGIKH
jgi:hypothetical protein